MANAIDLCTLGQCRLWLGIASGQGGNSTEVTVITTTIPAGVAAVGTQSVTPAILGGIVVNMVLGIDVGTSVEEYVAVSAVGSLTFTATFQNVHAANCTVIDATDSIIGRLITSVATQVLWITGRTNSDGSIPSASSLNAAVAYNEWYDGNGNNRLFLRQSPITTVSAVYVNGVSVPQSVVSTPPGSITPGWVIDQNGRALVMRTGGYYAGRYGYNSYYGGQTYGSVYLWINGTQNINIQYTAGYATTPYDINDIATRLVGLAYRRRAWIGYKQKAGPDQGNVTYDLSDMTEDDKRVLFNYRRLAQAG